ncbi:MAG TPA: acetylxylan esterase [Longimicrobiaceae bacterium]|nr:acetylxylan esterase [Longimicrobiaceae bacterium]
MPGLLLLRLGERYEAHVVAGTARTKVIVGVLVLIALCECLLLVWVLWAERRRRLGVFAVAQVLGLGLWFAGELKLNYPTSLVRRLDDVPPFEPVPIAGDPTLARLVEWRRRPADAPPPGIGVDSLIRWQVAARQALTSALGHDADASRAPGPVRVVADKVLPDGLRRQLITFQGFDGTPIPAYLFLPPVQDRVQPRPGLLVIAGHGEGIVQTAGLVRSLYHDMAPELARAGYVVLAPELRGFGYLGRYIGVDHCIVAHNALASGSHYAAMLTRDLAHATSVLASLPGVDPTRIGAAGVSFGGTLALLHTAVDRRIAAVMAGSPAIEPFRREGLTKSWDRRAIPETPFCHLIPGGGHEPNRLGLLYLIAPRPLLLTSGVREDLGMLYRAAVDSVAWAYSRLGAVRPPQAVEVEGAHEFFLRPTREFFATAFASGAR